ncbi:uncharacterized protein V1516DRAFT_674659 [Lipomyces oligophaga]|uniref:uncharacterized protein n=1 Tax=Lipomyces oligophaga TaxID=45792 RepID=UPI0034CD2735
MPTKPTNAALKTRVFTNALDARFATLHLYRRFLRAVPTISRLYKLDMPLATVRAKLRQEFERQRFVSNLPVISVLYAQGQMEYQETLNFWKQRPQIFKYFQQEEHPEKFVHKGFVDKFLEGTA